MASRARPGKEDDVKRRPKNEGRVCGPYSGPLAHSEVELGSPTCRIVLHAHGGRHIHITGTVLRKGKFVIENGRSIISGWSLA